MGSIDPQFKHAAEGAAPEHGGPASARPDGVNDHGIHPGSHEEGVDDIRLHASALSNGAGHDGAGCGRELRMVTGLGIYYDV